MALLKATAFREVGNQAELTLSMRICRRFNTKTSKERETYQNSRCLPTSSKKRSLRNSDLPQYERA